MKITICGSLIFFDEMLEVKKQLEALGHEVKMPPEYVDDGRGGQISVKDRYKASKAGSNDDKALWKMREMAMRNHFNKVDWADAILVVNEDKNDIRGYIGANTLMEMGLAFFQEKPIYLLHEIPEISYKEEILGMRPLVIHEVIEKI